MMFVIILLLLVFPACRKGTGQSFAEEIRKTEAVLSQNKMLHLKQVIEYYDSTGNPIPRYFELFIAKGEKTAFELDTDGNIIQVYQDNKKQHISFDPVTLKAQKYQSNTIISPDLSMLAKDKDLQVTGEGPYEYAGQSCQAYMISDGNADDDVRIYLDSATGFLLFCDAPLFCIKTADIEVLPYEGSHFGIPDDLKYE
jgi:hypothetical protein